MLEFSPEASQFMLELANDLRTGRFVGWVLMKHGAAVAICTSDTQVADVLNQHNDDPEVIICSGFDTGNEIEWVRDFDSGMVYEGPAHRLSCLTCHQPKWFKGSPGDNQALPGYICQTCETRRSNVSSC